MKESGEGLGLRHSDLLCRNFLIGTVAGTILSLLRSNSNLFQTVNRREREL